MRSDITMASSWSWVTKMKVMPTSRCKALSSTSSGDGLASSAESDRLSSNRRATYYDKARGEAMRRRCPAADF